VIKIGYKSRGKEMAQVLLKKVLEEK